MAQGFVKASNSSAAQKCATRCPKFHRWCLMAMMSVAPAIEEDNMSPKAAKLYHLTLATSMGPFKSNVVERTVGL